MYTICTHAVSVFHYFHCDQIGIPREIADKDGNLVWFGDYYGWGKLKSETNVTGTAPLSKPRIPLKDIQPDPIDWW
ncbi:RHS domain-containing protein [uncultured Veillonella sp.]|uniref:RHS domain-containing protein n=1 Tax=uncultured Veillonella sp. TaxID=159268 RepID=UPI0035A68A59